MAKLDINGYNATFKTFVEFAEKTQRDGYGSACANATLAGKRITVSALSLHETSYILRKTGEKTVNDSTRAIFRNAVAEMFGGEANIPESVKKAMHGADGEHLQQVYDDFDSGDAMYEPYGDDQQMTKMRMGILALDRINKFQRFDTLVAQAAGQDMNNYEMPEYDAKNVDYSQDLVDAIGRDFEDIVRANPDAYGPQ